MSESGIDMDRCLLGIDDEKTWVPEIVWINCAEQMPPNTMKFELIYRVNNEIKSGFGATFNVIADIHPRWESVKHLFEWTDYTPEKWEYLNK